MHGVPVAVENFDARIQYLRDQQSGESSESVRTLSFAGHWPDITPRCRSFRDRDPRDRQSCGTAGPECSGRPQRSGRYITENH